MPNNLAHVELSTNGVMWLQWCTMYSVNHGVSPGVDVTTCLVLGL
jgi:hypothetical protein